MAQNIIRDDRSWASLQVHADDLSNVSSLYGPGTVLGWHLTLLSCLVAWTLHPRRRRSGSIDANLIAGLTLPTVAAVHLISQIRASSTLRNDLNRATRPEIAAIEAPLVVLEIFMTFSVLFFVLAWCMKCFRRGFAVAAVGLLCFATECYVHFRLPHGYRPARVFQRSFVADSGILLLVIAAVLLICALAALGLTAVFFERRRHIRAEPAAILASDFAGDEAVMYALTEQMDAIAEESFQESTNMRIITAVTLFFLPVSFIPSLMGTTGFKSWESLSEVHITAADLARIMFPRTSYSLRDWDQAVAALAGGIVLAFSIYSVVHTNYQKRQENARLTAERRQRHVVRMRRLFLQRGVGIEQWEGDRQ